MPGGKKKGFFNVAAFDEAPGALSLLRVG